MGHCVPSSCTDQDVRIGFQNFLNNITNALDVGFNINAFIYNCHTAEESIPLDASDWVIGILILLLVLVILAGTVLDLWLNVLQLGMIPDRLMVVLQGFSLYENIPKLFHVGPNSEGLASIHGIRFISMTWVILGHTYLKYVTNNGFYNNFMDVGTLYFDSNYMAALRSAPFSVDTFFMIGATLLAYLTLKELERRKGGGGKFWAMYYVHRYIRLTGVYAVTVALHATYLKYLATGPNSYTLDDTRHKITKKGEWQTNVVINNLNCFTS
jgi:hypothetical protein